jgi:hypothetical protein
MTEQDDLEQFASRVHDDVIRCSQSDESGDGGSFEENEFTRYMLECLGEAGEVEEFTVCYYQKNRVKLNAYNFNSDESLLDLFLSIYTRSQPPVTVGKADVETGFRKLQSFFDSAIAGYHKKLEETAGGYDAARLIFENKRRIMRVRFFIVTDGLTTVFQKDDVESDDISYSFHVWDLRRIHRCKTSGQLREPIEINFRQQFGETIPCLPTVNCGDDFDACVAMIPGRILATIYGIYGSRLLERNVRSFLQLKGKINKGIKDTLLGPTPERFLAYNNGISATVEQVDFDTRGGNWSIIAVRGLQIVNGGQTTASIYYAHKRYKADLSKVYVQAKLSIVNPALVDEIVPKISRYANSQNKISEADFFANDAFHAKIKQFSDAVWAPARGGTQSQTQWYYERARGQFVDDKARSKKSAFEARYPTDQMFTKTDVAKFENLWLQLPHIVSKGAQKNFMEFTAKLGSSAESQVVADEHYFKSLIAKAILVRIAEQIVKKQKYAGYRAQILNYTVAYLVLKKGPEIDLAAIWKAQRVSANLEQAIATITPEVHRFLTAPPDGQNVTEWCKKESCWKSLQGTVIAI